MWLGHGARLLGKALYLSAADQQCLFTASFMLWFWLKTKASLTGREGWGGKAAQTWTPLQTVYETAGELPQKRGPCMGFFMKLQTASDFMSFLGSQ